MNFFKRFLGGRSAASLAAATTLAAQGAPLSDPAKDPNMIQVYDAYGREMYIAKETYRKTILPDVLKKEWQNSDRLYTTIIQSLKDGFAADVIDSAQQLQRIDTNAERGAVTLGVVYLQNKSFDEAEKVLNGFVKQHGESGIILTNLAKVYSFRGDPARADTTLWHALEVDPNQENALLWFAANAREHGGPAGYLAALRQVVVLPGSWRAKLWLARDALEKKDLDGAVILYRQVLEQTDPAPADVLIQISGDLGNNGQLSTIVELVAPRFRPAEHGIVVGNNLIKALVDLGRLGPARELVQQLYAQNRMDWKQTLSYWDAEIAKAQAASTPVDSPDKVRISFLDGEGPIWLTERSPANELFPVPVGEPVRIAFLGSSAEAPNMGDKIRTQATDGPGRYSRALSLFFAEQVRFGAVANVRTLVPWMAAPHAGFVLCGTPWTNSAAAEYARQKSPACDYVVITHLKATSEPWQVDIRLVRTVDGTCLGTIAAKFPAAQPQAALPTLADDLLKQLVQHAGVTRTTIPSLYQAPAGGDLPPYLVRLEQLLAVRCASMENAKGPADFLSGERDIIDGNIQLCLSQPRNPTVRILLLQTCLSMKRIRPDIVAEYRDKLQLLQREHPLAEPAQGVVQRMVNDVFAE
jgi:tetratricopeptide (TPR) repeat protein